MQRQVEEGIHRPAFRRPFLFHGGIGVDKQGLVFRVAGGDVGGSDLGADQRQAFDVFSPGVAEEAADLFAGGIKHGRFRRAG